MTEIAVKTHLIITDIHSEYEINWCGKFIDAKPLLKNGMPIFILISHSDRTELNTFDMKAIEEAGKRITHPRGRGAVAQDKAYIYLKEVDGKERLMGSIIHKRIKTFAPMYDKVGYR